MRCACLILLLAAVTASAAGPQPGAWRPVAGDLGDAAVMAITRGGDGARYATAGGWIHRQPADGGPWRTVGPYAPDLRWEEGQAVDAVGPFPQAWLDRVSADAFEAIEASAASELNDDLFTDDAARLLLQAYVEETDPPLDSPYRLVALLPATDGVWVVTGAGVLRASALGVRGPIGDIVGAKGAVVFDGALWVAAADRLWQIPADGQAVLHRIAADTLAADSGGLLYQADGVVWTWPGRGAPVATPTPTGDARQVAAWGTTRWAATGLALYRSSPDGWRLCPPTGVEARRLVAGPFGVVIIAEDRLVYVDAGCEQLERQPPPWPGGMALHDVHVEGDQVWLATSAGLNERVDASVAAADEARVAAFKRALKRLPTVDETSAAALRYHQLDRKSRGFGRRPLLRGLVPDLTATYVSRPSRQEVRDQALGQLFELRVRQPLPAWRVMATWTVRFDLLAMMFDIERDSTLGGLEDMGELDALPLDDQVSLEEALPLDGESLAETTGDFVEPEDLFIDDDLDDSASLAVDDGATFALLAVERRQAERDRQRLLSDVAKHYRDRIRIMFRLWVQLEPDGLHLSEVMRLRELDARLDALTGGEFTRYAPILSP